MKCQYCQNNFVNNSSLKLHQKSAKYCLKMRNKSVSYLCKFCDTTYTSEQNLNKHYKVCSNKIHIEYQQKYEDKLEEKDKTISELRQQISVLQDKLENIAIRAATKPTSVTNNTQNNVINMEPLSLQYIEEQSHLLSIDHIKRGARGYAELAHQMIKDRVKLTDKNRRNMKFKDSNGGEVTDNGMVAFQKLFGAGISKRNRYLIERYIHREKEKQELAGIKEMDTEMELLPIRRNLVAMIEMANGDQTKLGTSICKILSAKLGSQGVQQLIQEVDEMLREDGDDPDIMIEDDTEDEYLWCGDGKGGVEPI